MKTNDESNKQRTCWKDRTSEPNLMRSPLSHLMDLGTLGMQSPPAPGIAISRTWSSSMAIKLESTPTPTADCCLLQYLSFKSTVRSYPNPIDCIAASAASAAAFFELVRLLIFLFLSLSLSLSHQPNTPTIAKQQHKQVLSLRSSSSSSSFLLFSFFFLVLCYEDWSMQSIYYCSCCAFLYSKASNM